MSGLSSRRAQPLRVGRPTIAWKPFLPGLYLKLGTDYKGSLFEWTGLATTDMIAGFMATVFQFPYRTVAEISLRALLRNLHTLRGLSGKEIIPVIKANAYGHGLIPIAKCLVQRGSCGMVAVATLEEAMDVRQNLPRGVAILVLSGFFPHQLEAYKRYKLTPVIHHLAHLKSLVGHSTLPDLHLEIDSGMHRLGILPSQMEEAVRVLEKLPVKLSGIATHFAESDDTSSVFIDQQIAVFEKILERLYEKRLLNTDARIHLSNTGGVLRGKGPMANAVRPGLGLFGVSPAERLPHGKELLPVLEWKTRILCIKPVAAGESVGYNRTYQAKRREKIAILPVGYADGYPRCLSNQSYVLVNGKRCPVRGIVSMDLMAVDVTSQAGAREGQAVTLIGGQGRVQLGAAVLARYASTISYEILCGLSDRVPRIYFD